MHAFFVARPTVLPVKAALMVIFKLQLKWVVKEGASNGEIPTRTNP